MMYSTKLYSLQALASMQDTHNGASVVDLLKSMAKEYGVAFDIIAGGQAVRLSGAPSVIQQLENYIEGLYAGKISLTEDAAIEGTLDDYLGEQIPAAGEENQGDDTEDGRPESASLGDEGGAVVLPPEKPELGDDSVVDGERNQANENNVRLSSQGQYEQNSRLSDQNGLGNEQNNEIFGEVPAFEKPVLESDLLSNTEDDIISSGGALTDDSGLQREAPIISPSSNKKEVTLSQEEQKETTFNAAVANNDDLVVNAGGSSGNINGTVLANDVQGSASSLNIVSYDDSGTTGTVVFDDATDSLTYATGSGYAILNANETVTDSFTYSIDDGRGGIDTATVTITIQGVNDNPDAIDNSFNISENLGTMSLYSSLVANDSDVDNGDSFTITSIDTAGTAGTVALDTSGATLTYDTGTTFDYLAQGESTTDTFTYTITDTYGGTDTATVTLTITGFNDAPSAIKDSLSINEDATSSNIHDLLLGNDTDPDDSDILNIQSVDTKGTVGSVVFDDATNSLVYTADNFTYLAQGETATDSFTYTIDDGNGATDTATVTYTITGQNDAPVAQDDNVTIDEDSTISGDLFADNGNGADSDPDTSDTVSVDTRDNSNLIAAGTNGGAFDIQSNGSFSFDPGQDFQYLDAGETAQTSVRYILNDNNDGKDTADIIVTVTGLNDAPTAVDDGIYDEVDEGGNTLTISTAQLMLNDTDPENDTLTVTNISVATGQGSIIDNGDGTWTYTSPTDSLPFQGIANLTYTLSDDGGLTDTGAFQIRVFNVINGTAGDDTLSAADMATPHHYYALDGNDVVTGSNERDILEGGNGDDTLSGNDGDDDFIISGALTGIDSFDGGAGDDHINGTEGDDSFTVSSLNSIEDINLFGGNDTMYFTTGDDTFNFAGMYIAGVETIDGNGGTDVITGTADDDTINLSRVTTMIGIDHIDGGDGRDTIYGSQSADHIYASAGEDDLHGEGGDDIFYVFGHDDSPDGYYGGDGYDKIVGTAGDDTIAIDGTGYRGFTGDLPRMMVPVSELVTGLVSMR